MFCFICFLLMLDVILSLVRTKSIGYLRDIRRWVVALSRARLGLYVLGRRKLFETFGDLQASWSKLIANGDQLAVVSGEMWPSERGVDDFVEPSKIDGIEHMGQHVYQMIERALQERGLKMD
jgi:intron-binding protein aquarius